MSRGQSQRRADSRKRDLESCKSRGKAIDVIDIDSDRIPNFIIIDAPEPSEWTSPETSTSGKDKSPVYKNVIFIDDDDDESVDCSISQDGSEEAENQYANFSSSNKHQPSCNEGRKLSSNSPNCWATSSRKFSSFKHHKFSSGLSFEGEDSDYDIMEDYMGNIRQQWEEASLRKKRFDSVGKGRSGFEDEDYPSGFAESQNLAGVKVAEALDGNHQNNNLNNMEDVKTAEAPNRNHQNYNFNLSACVGEDAIGGTSNKSYLEETFQQERCTNSTLCSTHVVNKTTLKPLVNSQSLVRLSSSAELASGDGGSDGQQCIIGNREMLKKTNAYKRAEEEEWASRQRELELQAQEARRLRKRKKAETLRLLDMERRQKQRVKEVREAQKKDEETLNLKEQLRSEVMGQIAKLEASCRDMASLLRGLGIDPGGGPFPSSSEVRAAYKQALLKFHPDRASRSDIRQQIEAEEKFKLISRAKERFLL